MSHVWGGVGFVLNFLTQYFQLRKKTSQMSSLEVQLDEKMREFSAHIARMKQLEEEVIGREEEADELRHQVAAHQAEIRKKHSSDDKKQQLHQEQCRDYEKQIDIVSCVPSYVPYFTKVKAIIYSCHNPVGPKWWGLCLLNVLLKFRFNKKTNFVIVCHVQFCQQLSLSMFVVVKGHLTSIY